MIHEPAKWAGWQSTTAAAQHLERLKQMQDQIYRILSARSGKPLRQIIKDTKRTGLLSRCAEGARIRASLTKSSPENCRCRRQDERARPGADAAPADATSPARQPEAAQERSN
jgi:hypothetical protein